MQRSDCGQCNDTVMSLENLKQRLKNLKDVISANETAKRISNIAATFNVIPEYKTRIFTDGLTTAGTPIGQYSTTPFYINPTTLVGVAASGISPEGIGGAAKFKSGKTKKTGGNPLLTSGKTRKTKYLKNGYSELRELTGRQNSTVDLNFSGALERSVQVVEEGNTAIIRYTNEEEAEKMTWAEERFGADISGVSDDERELGLRAAAIELRVILDSII